MSWSHHFDRARRSSSPVSVDKQQVGPLPPNFEKQGFSIDGIWGIYERSQGLETTRIYELPNQYWVSVSDPIAQSSPLLQQNQENDQQGNQMSKWVGLGVLGAAAVALGKAIGGSQSESPPDPKQAHRVFISHSWDYEDHFEEVKSLLDNGRGFQYFDHSVSSDEPIDAQLPNHLRKKIRDQMRSTNVVLVLAGMYVPHSDWIIEEIEMAMEMEKPIIGVVPEENDRVPNIVQEKATELVDADGKEVLEAIERQAT